MNSGELCASLGATLPPLFECSLAPQEGTRVRTPMMYPDGGMVDVFVLQRDDKYFVTDFGDALGWLYIQSVGRSRSQKQQLLIEDVCQTLGVELHHGQITLRDIEERNLGEGVIRLAQAVVRVSDIWFTMRNQIFQTTADDVEEWLREKQIPFERGVKQVGRSTRDWTIDFRVSGEKTTFVFLLSTGSRGAVRDITNRVVAGCVDLSHLKSTQPELSFVSLFDDTQDVWKQEDFSMVNSVSEVAYWSHPNEFARILKGV